MCSNSISFTKIRQLKCLRSVRFVLPYELHLFNWKSRKIVILWMFLPFNFSVCIYFEMYFDKAELSASLLQSSESHDPSEIILICWFTAQEMFTIINVENSCCLIFCRICFHESCIFCVKTFKISSFKPSKRIKIYLILWLIQAQTVSIYLKYNLL